MNVSTYLKTSLIVVGLMAASSSFSGTMVKPEYLAAKSQIHSDYETERASCNKTSGNEREICTEKAKAKEKVGKAELEFNFSGKASDARRLAVVKADTTYSVAKEICDDKTGGAEDACEKEAKAVHVKALADAKMRTKTSGTK